MTRQQMVTRVSAIVVVVLAGAAVMDAAPPLNAATGTTSPDIVSLTPSSGPVGGGTSVTVKGVNLAMVNACGFGFGSAMVEEPAVIEGALSNTEIMCQAPPAVEGKAGTTFVRVTEDSGTNSKAFYPLYKRHIYSYYEPPVVHVISPDHGPATGRTVMRLTVQGLSESSDQHLAACLFETKDGPVTVPLVTETCAPRRGPALPNCTATCETPQICFQHDPIHRSACEEQTLAFKISLNGQDFHDNAPSGAAGDLEFKFQNEWVHSS